MQETPEQTINRLSSLIEERKPKGYSEMTVNLSEVSYLTELEREELHSAKMSLPTSSELASLAKQRNTERFAKRKLIKRGRL